MKYNALIYFIFMKQRKLPLLLILLVFSQSIVFAQQEISVADSVNSRLSHLINSSNSYQQYKVIKKTKINSLKEDIHGEVAKLEDNIHILHEKLDKQEAQIEEFEQKLTKNKTKLEEANTRKNQLSILGINTQKSVYNLFVLLLTITLMGALLYFIYKYNNSKKITSEASEKLQKNEEEFTLYKKKALETQQNLGRQLIDERKKRNSSQSFASQGAL